MRKIIFLLACFLLIQCSDNRVVDPISNSEEVNLKQFQQLDNSNKLLITDKNEPGEELLLCLTFIDIDSKKALSNRRVSFYHTSTNGEYEPTDANDETTARLNGTAITNEFGNIYVKTILPGDYGSSEDNRHIHTTVYGAKPENYDIFFKQYSGRTGRFMNSGNDQIFIAELKKTTDNKLVCFVTMEIKNPKTEG